MYRYSIRSLVCLFVLSFGLASPISATPCNSKETIEKIAGSKGTIKKLAKRTAVVVATPPVAFVAIEQIRKDGNRVSSDDYSDKLVGTTGVKMSNYGDSLSTGFHVDSELGSLDQMRTLRTTGSAFCDPKKDSGVYSVYRRVIDAKIPIEAITHARVGAAAIRFRPLPGYARFASTLRDLDEQVDEALSEGTFANLHLIWIGHNDLNWISDIEEFGLQKEPHLKRLPDLFYTKVEAQVERIIRRAQKAKGRSAIILLGLADLSSNMRVRAEIEAKRKLDPTLYPRANELYGAFPALAPGFLNVTVGLQNSFNTKLQELATKLTDLYRETRIKIVYSDSINKIIAKPEYLNEIDAFHLSNAGRNELAETVFTSKEFQEALSFIRN